MEDQQDVNPYASPQAAFDPVVAFGSKETLLSVARGLNLVYWGIAIILLTVLGGVVVGAAMTRPSPATAQMLGVGMTVGALVGAAVGMIGRITCLQVPEETRARPMIVGAVVLDVAAICLTLAVYFAPGATASRLNPVSQLVQLAASVLFVLFLKRVAAFIREHQLSARAQSLLYLGGFAAALGVLMFVGVAAEFPALSAFSGLLMMIVVLFAFLRYVRLLHDLRLAILRPAAS